MLKVGTSKADITPPIGIAHANWGSSIHQVAEGIDMPLYCNILYIESESSKNKIIILDLDLCIIDDEIDEMIRDSVISVIGCLLYTSDAADE